MPYLWSFYAIGRNPQDGSVYVIELDNPTSGNQSNRQATEQPKPDYTGNYFIRILIFDYFYDDHFIFV